ncbi:hypothetical protein GCM10009527_023460 [Actinomadura nitritigenes]
MATGRGEVGGRVAIRGPARGRASGPAPPPLDQHASQDRDKAIAAALGEAFKIARASDKGDKGSPKRSGTQRARKPK